MISKEIEERMDNRTSKNLCDVALMDGELLIFLPQIKKQEELMKEMLEIVKQDRKQYIECSRCEDQGNIKECKICSVKKLDNIIQKAKELIDD